MFTWFFVSLSSGQNQPFGESLNLVLCFKYRIFVLKHSTHLKQKSRGYGALHMRASDSCKIQLLNTPKFYS